MKKRLILLVFLFLCSFLLLNKEIHASEEFATNYNVRYYVQSNGTANVTQEIDLTNKLSNIYATQYSLIIQNTKVENIKAYDGDGPLKIDSSENDGKTTINLTFNQQVVGTGKTLSFKLNYDIPHLAQKNGQIWELLIPKLSEQNQADNYSLILAVPFSFGNPAFIRPQPVAQFSEEGFNTYRFTKNQLSASGINASFGPFQVFDFMLNYHLENPHTSLGKTEIALPPDTAFQQVELLKIEPEPLNVSVDFDGNWLAYYQLTPKEKITIIVQGKVKIFSQPHERFLQSKPENLKNNLKPQKFWEADNPLIKQRALELKTPKTIYDYVIKTLDYDFERVKEGNIRLGALKSLENPQRAICMEFTDLFIALARAAGIPAREVNGYAYTTNAKLRPLSLVADILHSWPEYWDESKKIWVPIDPTWGKTTGGIDYFSKTDLNHFAFVIHGENSTFPYPAGSYKKQENTGRDIEVVFGEYEKENAPKIAVIFDFPKKIFSGITSQGKIIIKNKGTKAIYEPNLQLFAEGIVLNKQTSLIKIPVLLPFSQEEIEVELKPTSFLTLGQGSVKLIANGEEFACRFKIGSLFWQIFMPFVGIIIVLIALYLLTQDRFYGKKLN